MCGFWNYFIRNEDSKRQRINELHEKTFKLLDKILEPPSYPFIVKTCSKLNLRYAINEIDREIAQLEKEIAEDRYKENKMERKVGEVFEDGNDVIEVIEWSCKNGLCGICYHYKDKSCKDADFSLSGSCSSKIAFKKIGEKQMDKKEELRKSMQEEEQRAKDSLANVEKMKKQLEELNKKVEVSATGSFFEMIDRKVYFFIDCENEIDNTIWEGDICDVARLAINNVFAIKKQAEQEALRREIQEYIRSFAMLNNENNDWRKKKGEKQYSLYFDIDVKVLNIREFNDWAFCGNMFFDTFELAEKCIVELNKKYTKEQQKVGFGVI